MVSWTLHETWFIHVHFQIFFIISHVHFSYLHARDGRMDIPGLCAQICTYTFVENSSKKILSISTFDKREKDKSVHLVKAGFIRGLE